MVIYRNTKGRPGQLLRPALAGAALAGAALGLAGLAITAATPAFAGSGRHWAHIAAGFDHTCGVTTSGTLWCWGANDHGQLGIGSTTSQNLPRPVTTPRQYGWASVATGAHRTCAIRTDHTVWCWGTTVTSSRGNMTDLPRPRQNTFPGRYAWTSVTVGGDQICAIRTNATLWCWGENNTGELGTGGSGDAPLPRQVRTPARLGWASVTAGSDYTCAVRTDSTLWCWGFGFFGQLGLGNNLGVKTPHQVTSPAPAGWASVTAGTAHTCAVRTDGTLWCWGQNIHGEVGIGNTTIQYLPQQVSAPAPDGWAAVAAGGGQTCAVRTGGTLWCWGDNSYGELGIGPEDTESLPYQVSTPEQPGWAVVSAGLEQTCAIRAGHQLWCWGGNGGGQLGVGPGPNQWLPQQVTGCRQLAARRSSAGGSRR
jgi:alpha-tubulin suppressor-like RCC1 family protein